MNARRLLLLGLLVTATNACAATTSGDASSSDSAINAAGAPAALANASYAGSGDFNQISDNPNYAIGGLVSTISGRGTVSIELTGSAPAQQEFAGQSFAEPSYTGSLRVDYPAETHKEAFVRDHVRFEFSPWSSTHRALDLPREIEVFFVAKNGQMTRLGTSDDKSVPGLNDRLDFATSEILHD